MTQATTMRGPRGCARSLTLTVPTLLLPLLARHALLPATSTCSWCKPSSSAYATPAPLVPSSCSCLAGLTSRPFTTCCTAAPAAVATPPSSSPCTQCCPWQTKPACLQGRLRASGKSSSPRASQVQQLLLLLLRARCKPIPPPPSSETSITIDDVVHVVDAGRCKSRLCGARMRVHSSVMRASPRSRSGFAAGDVAFDTLSVQWVTQASAAPRSAPVCCSHSPLPLAATGICPPAPRPRRPLPERLLLAPVPVICTRAHAGVQRARDAAYAAG